jgi:ribonucleotide monophosphatase NagD (HAD superfamily)
MQVRLNTLLGLMGAVACIAVAFAGHVAYESDTGSPTVGLAIVVASTAAVAAIITAASNSQCRADAQSVPVVRLLMTIQWRCSRITQTAPRQSCKCGLHRSATMSDWPSTCAAARAAPSPVALTQPNSIAKSESDVRPGKASTGMLVSASSGAKLAMRLGTDADFPAQNAKEY